MHNNKKDMEEKNKILYSENIDKEKKKKKKKQKKWI